MGSTICTAGFPSAAIASSCFTARCDSIWYGFFIATLLFSAKENSLSAYQGWERGVATFYDLTDIPIAVLQGLVKAVQRELKITRLISILCLKIRFSSGYPKCSTLFEIASSHEIF